MLLDRSGPRTTKTGLVSVGHVWSCLVNVCLVSVGQVWSMSARDRQIEVRHALDLQILDMSDCGLRCHGPNGSGTTLHAYA